MRLTVFASASPTAPASFLKVAEDLGRMLAEAGVEVVYGGGSTGLMGALARGVRDAGGSVTGVVPRRLLGRESNLDADPAELIVVDTMHERKARMAELADGFVALPGGAGTLEELLEMWTWQHLGYHDRPVALVDADGFWAPLLQLLDDMVQLGLLREVYRQSLIHTGADSLIEVLRKWQPPPPRYPDP